MPYAIMPGTYDAACFDDDLSDHRDGGTTAASSLASTISTSTVASSTDPTRLPDLPPELWSQIASFVPRLPDQDAWHAWQHLRSLNHTFKAELERFYIRHYLRRTVFRIDCGGMETLKWGYLNLEGNFEFDGFEGEGDRIAVFRDKEIHRDFAKIMARALNSTYAGYADAGYHPSIVVQVRREQTDLLPMDLKAHFRRGEYALRFDWRTYLCTYLDELHARDAATRKVPMAVADGGWMGFAKQIFGGGKETGGGSSNLMDAMGKVLKAVTRARNEAFITVRRERRRRMGLKNQKWLRGEPKDTLEWYATLDEEEVLSNMRRREFALDFFVCNEEERIDEEGDQSGDGRSVIEGDGTDDDDGDSDESSIGGSGPLDSASDDGSDNYL